MTRFQRQPSTCHSLLRKSWLAHNRPAFAFFCGHEKRRLKENTMSTATNSVTKPTNSVYALGYANAEHDRLIRQAALLAPITERFFREVGLGPEQRVLDLGSGLGDVSMVAAELVGPSGQVVGIERDASSI